MKFVFVASIFLHISVLGENEVGAVRLHKQHQHSPPAQTAPSHLGAEDSGDSIGASSTQETHDSDRGRAHVERTEQMSPRENDSAQDEEHNIDNGTGINPHQPEVPSHDLHAQELKEGESDRETDIKRHPVDEGDSDNGNEEHADEELFGGSSNEQEAEDAHNFGDDVNLGARDKAHARKNGLNTSNAHRDGADSGEDLGSVEVDHHGQVSGEDEDQEQRFKARAAGNSSSIQMSAGENAICQGSDEVKVTVSKVEGTSSTKEVSISVTWKDADFETETGNIKTSEWSKNYDTGSITKSTHILLEITRKGKQPKNFEYKIGELLADESEWTKKETLTHNGHVNLDFECAEKRPDKCTRNGQCPWNESCNDSNECEADKTDWRPRSGASMMVNYLALALSMI